jgi:LysR family glycine cleavage system transcriptional activator
MTIASLHVHDVPTAVMIRLSRPPPTRSLRVFCVAARHRSFKFAADELHLTPSAVSHQMKELEETLGTRLFERKPRSLELTRAGAALVEEVEPLLEALDRSVAQIVRGGGRRKVRMVLPPFFASELLIPRLGEFCARHPGIDIQIDSHDPRPAVHSLSADVSVLLLDAAPQGLQCARLFPLSLSAACAPQHLPTIAQHGSTVFAQFTLIVHKPSADAWPAWAQEVGIATPEPARVLELDTLHAVVRAAEHGVGIALVPTRHCYRSFHAGTLVRVFAVELPTADSYYLVYRAKDGDKPAVRALIDWLHETFGCELADQCVE